MKILQITHSLPFLNQAGTEIYSYNLSMELAKRHEVYIFSRVCDLKQKEYEVIKKDMDGMKIRLINNTFKDCSSFEMYYKNPEIDKKFAVALDEINPDIVHVQHLVFLSTGIIREIKKRGIPIVFTIHDYWLMCPKWHLLRKDYSPCDKAGCEEFDKDCLDCLKELLFIKKGAKRFYIFTRRLFPGFIMEYFKKIYFILIKRSPNNVEGISRLKERNRNIKDLLNMIDVFLAPSEYVRDKFVEFGIQKKKIIISRHGLDIKLFQGFHKTISDKIRFAFIGTILPAKGLHVLIEAFNRVADRGAELKIYGKIYPYIGFEHYLPYLRGIIKNKNIIFMDEFNHKDIAAVFKNIDVLIVPSIWHENAPSVILEAFITNTPVIVTNIGGMPEFVSSAVNSFLFNPGDSSDLLEKIERIINNPDIVSELKSNMPRIKSIEENAKEIEDIYSCLIEASDKNIKYVPSLY